jgi:hypothetical protein
MSMSVRHLSFCLFHLNFSPRIQRTSVRSTRFTVNAMWLSKLQISDGDSLFPSCNTQRCSHHSSVFFLPPSLLLSFSSFLILSYYFFLLRFYLYYFFLLRFYCLSPLSSDTESYCKNALDVTARLVTTSPVEEDRWRGFFRFLRRYGGQPLLWAWL